MAGNKGALSLLEAYGEDSSDEEVPGNRVSTKRMHRDDENYPNQKRFEKLPVPSCMIAKIDDCIEDPALHDGKVRGFAHERGNWATYLYVPYESNEGLNKLLTTITNIVPKDIGLKGLDEYHLSLTKTVILKHHWIDSFISTIKENISYLHKFIIMLGSLEIYCNEERTRTFISLKTETGVDTLTKLVHCLDACLDEFKLPPFYKDPSFHISIAWCVGDCEEILKLHLPQINDQLQEIMTEFSQENWYIYVQQIYCKTGNKLFLFNLN